MKNNISYRLKKELTQIHPNTKKITVLPEGTEFYHTEEEGFIAGYYFPQGNKTVAYSPSFFINNPDYFEPITYTLCIRDLTEDEKIQWERLIEEFRSGGFIIIKNNRENLPNGK
jgi:hypothetical protein